MREGERERGEKRIFFLIKGKKRIGRIDYGPTRILHALCVTDVLLIWQLWKPVGNFRGASPRGRCLTAGHLGSARPRWAWAGLELAGPDPVGTWSGPNRARYLRPQSPAAQPLAPYSRPHNTEQARGDGEPGGDGGHRLPLAPLAALPQHLLAPSSLRRRQRSLPAQ